MDRSGGGGGDRRGGRGGRGRGGGGQRRPNNASSSTQPRSSPDTPVSGQKRPAPAPTPASGGGRGNKRKRPDAAAQADAGTASLVDSASLSLPSRAADGSAEPHTAMLGAAPVHSLPTNSAAASSASASSGMAPQLTRLTPRGGRGALSSPALAGKKEVQGGPGMSSALASTTPVSSNTAGGARAVSVDMFEPSTTATESTAVADSAPSNSDAAFDGPLTVPRPQQAAAPAAAPGADEAGVKPTGSRPPGLARCHPSVIFQVQAAVVDPRASDASRVVDSDTHGDEAVHASSGGVVESKDDYEDYHVPAATPHTTRSLARSDDASQPHLGAQESAATPQTPLVSAPQHIAQGGGGTMPPHTPVVTGGASSSNSSGTSTGAPALLAELQLQTPVPAPAPTTQAPKVLSVAEMHAAIQNAFNAPQMGVGSTSTAATSTAGATHRAIVAAKGSWGPAFGMTSNRYVASPSGVQEVAVASPFNPWYLTSGMPSFIRGGTGAPASSTASATGATATAGSSNASSAGPLRRGPLALVVREMLDEEKEAHSALVAQLLGALTS